MRNSLYSLALNKQGAAHARLIDMLYQYLILLCLGVVAHAKIVYDRYATFYNSESIFLSPNVS